MAILNVNLRSDMHRKGWDVPAGPDPRMPRLQDVIGCFRPSVPCHVPPPHNNNHFQPPQVRYLIAAASLRELSRASQCHVLSRKPWV